MSRLESLLRLVRARRRAGVAARPSPRKRPPKGSAPVMAEPPRGPLPMQGGAEVALEFDS